MTEKRNQVPIANVGRIMKKSLPPNAKISKEAKQTVQECVSEFINFITGEASDKCQREKRKTINGDDLLWAMSTLGFRNYVGTLKVFLRDVTEVVAGDNNSIHTDVNEVVVGDIDDVNAAVSVHVTAHFRGFGDGVYSLAAQVTNPQNYGDDGGRGISYGDGNGNRAKATHVHKVDW